MSDAPETQPAPPPPSHPPQPAGGDVGQSPRRGFLTKLGAILAGGIAMLVPLIAGLGVFLDPLFRRQRADAEEVDDEFLRVASLDALPVGTPQRVRVISDRKDAWNLFPGEPIGAVYLIRTETDDVQAFNVICPHAGCPVDFSPSDDLFHCPCHKSSFRLDGAIDNPDSPSPRGLDSLEVKIVADTEVWLKFQNFRAADPRKIPEV